MKAAKTGPKNNDAGRTPTAERGAETLRSAGDERILSPVQARKQIRLAAALLPEMAAVVNRIHEPWRRKAALLAAWAGLAGIVMWTPEMVAKVERVIGGRG